MAQQPLVRQGLLIVETSRSLKTHHTFGRNSLDGWSAVYRDLYLTIHNIHKKQTSMPWRGFEPAIPANARQKAHALDRVATGIGSTIDTYPNKAINRLSKQPPTGIHVFWDMTLCADNPSKYDETLTSRHCVTSQQTCVLTNTAVRTSNFGTLCC
jgi:hypothetical protein